MMKERGSKRRVPVPIQTRGRAIHLIDIENLAGSSTACLGGVSGLRKQYSETAGIGAHNQLVIATGPNAAPIAFFDWGQARRLVRRGVNGADLALLQVIESEHLGWCFERVVIASGDGIFAEACASLQATGCQVTVVTRPGALSTRLRLAVRDIRYLRREPIRPAAALERTA